MIDDSCYFLMLRENHDMYTKEELELSTNKQK